MSAAPERRGPPGTVPTRRLELIHLRPGAGQAAAVLAHLAELRRDLESAAGPAELRIFTQVGLASDLAVHLIWNDDRSPERTPLGVIVAESLRAFGPIHHSVWKEETR